MNFGKGHQTIVSLLEFFARSGSSADRAMEDAIRFVRAFPGCVLRMPKWEETNNLEAKLTGQRRPVAGLHAPRGGR